MKKNPKLHLGHYGRVRYKILHEEVENIDDIIAIEMLLQLPMQRGDTNEVAKGILANYGSFDKFCRLAKYDDLLAIDGIGPAIAEKLMCFIKLFRFCTYKSLSSVQLNYSNLPEFVRFLRVFYEQFDHEVLMLFVINSRGEVCFQTILQHGDTEHVLVDMNRLVELTRIHKGEGIVISHNHPVGSFYPSTPDFTATQTLMAFCHSRGVKFYDHIIVSKQGFFSFKASQLLHAMQIRLTNKIRERRQIYAED